MLNISLLAVYLNYIIMQEKLRPGSRVFLDSETGDDDD